MVRFCKSDPSDRRSPRIDNRSSDWYLPSWRFSGRLDGHCHRLSGRHSWDAIRRIPRLKPGGQHAQQNVIAIWFEICLFHSTFSGRCPYFFAPISPFRFGIQAIQTMAFDKPLCHSIEQLEKSKPAIAGIVSLSFVCLSLLKCRGQASKVHSR